MLIDSNVVHICALSDTHGQDFTIPMCDIFCHCGDWSPLYIQGDFAQMYLWVDSFVETLYNLPCRYVVIIAGNHDLIMESETAANLFDEIQEKLGLIKHYIDDNGERRTEKKIHYLNCHSVKLMGVKFWGSPVTKQINRYRKYWAFETNTPSYDIPTDTDVILTHQPPELNGLGNVRWGICEPSEPLGSMHLTEAVSKTRAQYHFCGHIHTGNHSECRYPNGITVGVNVSILDEDYEKAYDAFVCQFSR